jgi:hypothetical protein
MGVELPEPHLLAVPLVCTAKWWLETRKFTQSCDFHGAALDLRSLFSHKIPNGSYFMQL